MITGRNIDEQKIIKKVKEAGQEHVLHFWPELSDIEKSNLINQLSKIDFSLINILYRDNVLSGGEKDKNDNLKPAEFIPVPKTEEQKSQANEAKETGEDALKSGRVAAFLVAGGQGTRLGFDGPKGCFPAAPVTGKTLFEIHAEKIAAAAKKYNVVIPWYIMTSQANHKQTVKYFKEKNYLGFDASDIMFFMQEMLPAVDKNGKLILDSKSHVFMSPNGHGGSISALLKSGAIEDMESRGIDIISYFQVDNVLVKIIDPEFIGYHIKQNAEMSSKMAIKAFPEEKIGVFGTINNKLKVIEYSDLSRKQMYGRNPDGSLRYSAGSIAIHLINRDFVRLNMKEGMCLPFHAAHKKIPCIDEHGIKTATEKPNGYKFETFVFDALAGTTSSVIMEIKREHEFSPVKNRVGNDSAETAKRDISNYFGAWIEKAGVPVPRDKHGNVKVPIEISPFFAIDEEEFIERFYSELNLSEALYIGNE